MDAEEHQGEQEAGVEGIHRGQRRRCPLAAVQTRAPLRDGEQPVRVIQVDQDGSEHRGVDQP